MSEAKWTAGPEMDFLLMETLGVAIERVRNRKDVAAEGGVGGPGCGASLGLWSDILAHLEAADRYYRRHSAAPDLYEALTDLLALFDEVAPGYAESTIAFAARAALAKVSPQALSTLSTETGEKAGG